MISGDERGAAEEVVLLYLILFVLLLRILVFYFYIPHYINVVRSSEGCRCAYAYHEYSIAGLELGELAIVSRALCIYV